MVVHKASFYSSCIYLPTTENVVGGGGAGVHRENAKKNKQWIGELKINAKGGGGRCGVWDNARRAQIRASRIVLERETVSRGEGRLIYSSPRTGGGAQNIRHNSHSEASVGLC